LGRHHVGRFYGTHGTSDTADTESLWFTESLRCELLHERSNVHVTMVQMPAVNTPQFDWVLSPPAPASAAGATDLPTGDRRPRDPVRG
jgi:hypothetical protein